jgi:hypothetical protein
MSPGGEDRWFSRVCRAGTAQLRPCRQRKSAMPSLDFRRAHFVHALHLYLLFWWLLVTGGGSGIPRLFFTGEITSTDAPTRAKCKTCSILAGTLVLVYRREDLGSHQTLTLLATASSAAFPYQYRQPSRKPDTGTNATTRAQKLAVLPVMAWAPTWV